MRVETSRHQQQVRAKLPQHRQHDVLKHLAIISVDGAGFERQIHRRAFAASGADFGGGLDRPGNAFRDGATKQDGGTGKDKQRHRVAEAPGQPVLDDVPDLSAARGDAGHRGDMIGLERVLHTEQKPQSQNSEHLPLLAFSHHDTRRSAQVHRFVAKSTARLRNRGTSHRFESRHNLNSEPRPI